MADAYLRESVTLHIEVLCKIADGDMVCHAVDGVAQNRQLLLAEHLKLLLHHEVLAKRLQVFVFSNKN